MKKKILPITAIAVFPLFAFASIYSSPVQTGANENVKLFGFVRSILLCDAPSRNSPASDIRCVTNDGTVTVIRSRTHSAIRDSVIVIP